MQSMLIAVLAVLIALRPARPSQPPAVNPGDPSTRADFEAGDTTREQYQRATELVQALGVGSGAVVADVGAGAGYYSMRLSALVGPQGRVIAEDISETSIRWLQSRVTAFGLSRVSIVKGNADDPMLPPQSLDAVLIVDSYHHFTQPQPMLAHILQSLKPGGRLVIADYSLREHRSEARADQLRQHEIDPVLVKQELEAARFQVRRIEDPLLAQIPAAQPNRIGAADLWLMVAVRPR